MIRRAAGWAARRLFHGADGPGRAGARALLSAARGLRPAGTRLSLRSSLRRLPPTNWIPPSQEARNQEAGHLRAAALAWLVCAALAVGPLAVLTAAGGLGIFALGPLTAGALMAAAGLHRDYLAWMIEQNRPRDPMSYLRRCPAVFFRSR